MKLSKLLGLIRPLFAIAVVGGAGAAAYYTQETWWPYVFPSKPPEKAAEEHEHADPDDAPKVKLSKQAQQNLTLDVAEPTPREYWRAMVIPGMVVDRPGESDRKVSSKVAGEVTDLKVRLGDSVRPGDSLFTIKLVSEPLQLAQADLVHAATELSFAEKELDRLAGLKGEIVAGTELFKQQSKVAGLKSQVRSARSKLLSLGLTAEQIDRAEKGEAVTEVVVSAPGASRPVSALNGGAADEQFEVRNLHAALGDHVMAGQTLCQLANHRNLLVEGAAFKSEAKALAAIAASRVPVEVEFAEENRGDWPAPKKLVVTHIAEHVDPATRTFAFYLPLENQQDKGVWRFSPGQRVRLRVPIERLTTRRADGTERDPFVLPAGAVVREGAEAFVFVKVEDIFVRRPVRVLYDDRTDAVVANDGSISRVDLVVRNNAAALNRAIKAAGGGEGHDHDH